jgi:hypothetical protein
LTSLAFRAMQTFYNETPIISYQQENKNNLVYEDIGGKKNTYALQIRMKISTAITEIGMEVPQKTKNKTTSYTLLGIYPKESKTAQNTDACVLTVIVILFKIP